MNPRKFFFIASVLLAVAGCSSTNKHLVGAWQGKLKGEEITLTLNSDSSYTAKSVGDLAHGRWTGTDTAVQLFHDARESKENSFGDSQSSTLTFSAVEDTLTLATPQAPVVFHRVKP